MEVSEFIKDIYRSAKLINKKYVVGLYLTPKHRFGKALWLCSSIMTYTELKENLEKLI